MSEINKKCIVYNLNELNETYLLRNVKNLNDLFKIMTKREIGVLEIFIKNKLIANSAKCEKCGKEMYLKKSMKYPDGIMVLFMQNI